MKYKYIIISFILLFPLAVQAQKGYYFFSKEDIANIKSASDTGWGKKIVDKLDEQVESRRKHSLRVPLLEGGHLHHYFCPVHNVMFEFDWDKPYEHYCNACGKYWENVNQYDWAWINMLHAKNLDYLTACMYLYMASGDKKYQEYIRDMMVDYANKYPTYFEHNPNRKPTDVWSGKMFGQSLDEAVWASDAARAYLVAKPVMTGEEIRKIENGYLKACADMLLKRRGAANWQVWHNSGLIALGVALGNDSIIDVALNDPQCGYHRMMEAHVYDDGWWNEGSPIYHYYPLRAMLLSADAVRCRDIDLFDEKLRNMFVAPAMGVYADLSFPAHNDGWYGESLVGQAKLYEIAYERFRDNILKEILQESYKYTERASMEALQNPVDLSAAPGTLKRESTYFKDNGYALLVSGRGTVVLKYGPHGGGHGHPDKLSISIHDGEKEIVTDMGTSAYGVPDFTNWYRKTLSHSTLIVDFADQKPTTGKLLEFKAAKNGGYVKAESSEAYPGVEIARSVKLERNKLTDILTANSKDEHTYDYVLMLTDKPVFESEGEPAVLDDTEVYTRIHNIEKWNGRKSFSCKTGLNEFTINVAGAGEFEIFTGTASGIPPSNPQAQKAYEAKPAYPLIVRVKGKNIDIKTDWKLDIKKN